MAALAGTAGPHSDPRAEAVTFIILLAVYWFVAALAVLWADEHFELDITGGHPLLAGFYCVIAPMLAPFVLLGGIVFLIGAVMLKVSDVLARKS